MINPISLALDWGWNRLADWVIGDITFIDPDLEDSGA